MKPAIFLDRDGTLIQQVHLLHTKEEIRVFPEAIEAVRRINDAGLAAIVVTNQSVIARRMITDEELRGIHQHIGHLFRKKGAILTDFYFCPHHPDFPMKEIEHPCHCRKPAPGLIRKAAADYRIALEKSCLIGDRLTDIEAGQKAGCLGVLVRTGHGSTESLLLNEDSHCRPDHIAPNIADGVDWFLSRFRSE